MVADTALAVQDAAAAKRSTIDYDDTQLLKYVLFSKNNDSKTQL